MNEVWWQQQKFIVHLDNIDVVYDDDMRLAIYKPLLTMGVIILLLIVHCF